MAILIAFFAPAQRVFVSGSGSFLSKTVFIEVE
jgi:hypothetical protein